MLDNEANIRLIDLKVIRQLKDLNDLQVLLGFNLVSPQVLHRFSQVLHSFTLCFPFFYQDSPQVLLWFSPGSPSILSRFSLGSF